MIAGSCLAIDKPLPITNTVYEVFGEMGVIADTSLVKMRPSDLPKDLRGKTEPLVPQALAAQVEKWKFDIGSELTAAFLSEFARRGLIVQKSGDPTGRQLYLGLHEYSLCQRFGAVITLPAYPPAESKSVGQNGNFRIEQLPPRERPIVLEDTSLYPSLVISVDLLNEQNELIWKRLVRIMPFEGELAGASPKRLVSDEKHFRKMWRIALRLAAESMAEALAKDRSVLFAAKAEQEILRLNESQLVDGVYFCPEARPTKRVIPVFPPQAVQEKLAGRVDVDLEVAEDGRVAKILAAVGEPSGVFESSARAAVRKWRFQVARKDDQPQRYRTRYTVRFNQPVGPDAKQ